MFHRFISSHLVTLLYWLSPCTLLSVVWCGGGGGVGGGYNSVTVANESKSNLMHLHCVMFCFLCIILSK